jgi:hypothetical protein
MTTDSPGLRSCTSNPKKGTLFLHDPACKRGSLLSFLETIIKILPVMASSWMEGGKDSSNRILEVFSTELGKKETRPIIKENVRKKTETRIFNRIDSSLYFSIQYLSRLFSSIITMELAIQCF